MKKHNKLEIIGAIMLIIGSLSWLSEKFLAIESLAPIYNFCEIVLSLGLAVWAFGYMRREQMEKDKSKTE